MAKKVWAMDVIERFERFYRDLGVGSLNQLVDVYDDAVVFIDPVAEHVGLEALEAYFSNLLQNCRSCRFDVGVHRHGPSYAFAAWVMTFEHAQLRQGKPITVEGISRIDIANDRIVKQRDYYDMGAMVYENVPVLGFIVAGLRRRMAL